MSLPFLQPYTGLSNGLQTKNAGGSVTYSTDFSSSTGWTLGTGATISGGTLNIVSGANSARNSYYDLGSVASTWVLRFKFSGSGLTNTASGQAEAIAFGIGSSNSQTGESPLADALMFRFAMHAADSSSNFYANSWEAAGHTITTGGSRATPLTITRWVEVTHQNNNLRVILYTDSSYTTVDETLNLAITSANYSGLRYILARTYSQVTGGLSNTFVIDDVKFYNGVTSV